MPEVFLSASASPDGWPEKGRHIGGQKAESKHTHKQTHTQTNWAGSAGRALGVGCNPRIIVIKKCSNNMCNLIVLPV
jgi:hypothetical protein